jgi:CRISPR locus-related DNA-binding protein
MTLGFEPGPLVSAAATAATEGLVERARIVVFTAALPDERADRAWLDFQRVLNMMGVVEKLGIKIEKHEIPLDDMVSAVLRIKQVFDELKGKSVKICITGGMRALGFALFIAYLLTNWEREPMMSVYLEGRASALNLPNIRGFLSVGLTRAQLELLKFMEPGNSYTPSDLASIVGRDRSTVYRSLLALYRKGLLDKNENKYTISKLGELLKSMCNPNAQ